MTEPPEDLAVRPEDEPSFSGGDLLSHVLSQISLSGEGIRQVRLDAGEAIPVAADRGYVCMVTAGALEVAGAGSPAIIAGLGDLLLLPRGAEAPHLRARGEAADIMVCRFRFAPDSLRGLLDALPPFILIRQAEGEDWLGGFLHFMTVEARDVQPGASLMISRLIDLAVIRALRTWVARGETSGWLGGLSDDRVARALKAIHAQPLQRWSIEALAGIAGMSRSGFCDRFTTLVGRSPLRYQNEWRLRLARDMLSRPRARIGEIGRSVGYEFEAAFSRAYKGLFGHSPRGSTVPSAARP